MEKFMEAALEEAKKAKTEGDLPFGAVVVCGDEIVGRGHAEDHTRFDVTAHAELTAVRQACASLQKTDLGDCVIICTNEPCLMCAATIFQAKIPKVVIGASREDVPFLRPRKLRIEDLAADLNYKPKIIRGFMKEKALELFKKIIIK